MQLIHVAVMPPRAVLFFASSIISLHILAMAVMWRIAFSLGRLHDGVASSSRLDPTRVVSSILWYLRQFHSIFHASLYKPYITGIV